LGAVEVGQDKATSPIHAPKNINVPLLDTALRRGCQGVCPESPEQCVTIRRSARVEYSVRGHRERQKLSRAAAPGRCHTRRLEDSDKMGKRNE
jgi:hypothetical protein